MKKVLHRSFKPAKCKIALQMAGSRLKILKNKKDTHLKQLRRELAHLLESGQTQTAKIRVEHVVREEKTVAAYELVGIYCELLVARLGVIEAQKNCPNDLKEAVASVLYASQRLSDVTELSDIVKHFSAKYGKDFVSAAIGLQPDSGVSRLLVEKLSVKAPDVPTKIKILTEIAAEHKVTWKAESLVESDPKETVLLSGAIGINSDSSRILGNEPPELQAPATVNVSQNSYATDGGSSRRTTSTDFNTGKTSDNYHQDPIPCGDRADGKKDRHPNPGYGDSSPWETEFVDATTAARAAAESAERASFAARAAAELSSKERMQNSTESRNSSSCDNLKNEPPHRRSSSSNVKSIGYAKEEMTRSSNRQGDQSTTTEAESSKKTVHEQSENASWRRGHSRDNSTEMRLNDSFAKIGREKQQTQPGMDDINLSRSEDVLLKKQSSLASSGSHSRNFSDDNNVTANAPSILEESRFQSTGKDTVSHNHGPDVVDDYSLFFDKPQFDTEDAYHDEPEQGLGFSLLGSKTPNHMPTKTNTWSFKEHSSASTSQILEKEKTSSPIFDDAPTTPPASLHEPEPSAKFDDYDRDSESEEDKGILPGHVEEKPKLTSHKSPICEVPDDDDLGRYFFPSDTEDQGDDSGTKDESDSETPTALTFGLENEKTLPPYGMSPPRDETLPKSVKEHVPTDVDPSRTFSSQTVSSSSIYSHKASNPDKRPSTIPPDSSSSGDETEMELPKRVSSRNQDKSTESRAWTSHLHSRVSHEDLEEEILTRASIRSPERRDNKTTPASASASYFESMPSDDDDEKEVCEDAARVQTKPTNSRFSRRTKGQERKSSPVSAKTDKVSHDQESPPKPTPEAKPLDKQQGSGSSSNSLPKTSKVFHYQESPPKLTPEAKSLAKQEGSSSPQDDAETLAKEKASHVHPKLPDYDDIFAKLGALRR